MAFSEKLYELRKNGNLSQEQLAEQLGVSRQAISKWETGKAIPESETLISISKYFDVTLDELMKENDTPSEVVTDREKIQTKIRRREKRMIGLVICFTGIVCLLVWGMVSIFMPSALDQIRTASMIMIDGNGIVLIICLAGIIAGAVLLLKNGSDQ